jgi:hypothetical protein
VSYVRACYSLATHHAVITVELFPSELGVEFQPNNGLPSAGYKYRYKQNSLPTVTALPDIRGSPDHWEKNAKEGKKVGWKAGFCGKAGQQAKW